MVLGGINSWGEYQHIESGRIVEVHNAELQVKTERYWQTSILYSCKDDESRNMFAVPVDDFRKRFTKITEPK